MLRVHHRLFFVATRLFEHAAMAYDSNKHLAAVFRFIRSKHDLAPLQSSGIRISSLCAGTDTVQVALTGLLEVLPPFTSLLR